MIILIGIIYMIIVIMLLVSPLWPIGLVLLIGGPIVYKKSQKNKQKEMTLAEQIDLIAKQLDIQYGNTNEKLEQIAHLAVKGREQGP